MKNITPINPNVVPESSNQNSSRPIEAEQQSVVQQPTLAQPEVLVQEISQEVPQNPLPQKPQPPAPEPQSGRSVQSIYPTPLTLEEREEIHRADGIPGRPYKEITPFSQIGIPLIMGGTSLYLLVLIIPLLSGASASLGMLGLPGKMEKVIWLYIFGGLLTLVLTAIASYKVLRGSLVALALLTGPVSLFLLYSLLGKISRLVLGASIFYSTSTNIITVVEVVLAILLVLAWTRERKAYL